MQSHLHSLVHKDLFLPGHIEGDVYARENKRIEFEHRKRLALSPCSSSIQFKIRPHPCMNNHSGVHAYANTPEGGGPCSKLQAKVRAWTLLVRRAEMRGFHNLFRWKLVREMLSRCIIIQPVELTQPRPINTERRWS